MTSMYDRENRQTFASHAGEDEYQSNGMAPQKHHHNTSGMQHRKADDLSRESGTNNASRSTKKDH